MSHDLEPLRCPPTFGVARKGEQKRRAVLHPVLLIIGRPL